MYTYTNTICNHLLNFLDNHHIHQVLGQHKYTDKWAKKFNTRSTFLSLFMAQILWVDSLRCLETILHAQHSKLYHLWMKEFHRSTFSDRVNKLNPTVFQSLFYHLVHQSKIILGQHKTNTKNKVFAIDSTLISLTLSVFNRAYYRTKKWAVKVHTRMDLELWIPDLIIMTDWKKADSPLGKSLINWIPSWSFVVIDRGYLDYDLLDAIDSKHITFVSRTKTTTQYCPVIHNQITHPQVQFDAIVEFIHSWSQEKYSWSLRVIRWLHIDEKSWETKLLEFITNNLELPAEDIANLYKSRRQIELLFKWIKQNCVIKAFLWTSQNAVENQIRVALCYYVLLVLIKHSTNTKHSLLVLVRKINTLLFHRLDFVYILWNIPYYNISLAYHSPPQETLFSHMF